MAGLDDEVHLLSGAYAADALEPGAEREAFEVHLSRCPQCREEVRTLRETAALLGGQSAVAPPEALRARVLETIARTPQEPVGRPPFGELPGRELPVGEPSDVVPITAARPRAGRRRWARPLVAAAAALVVAGSAGVGIVGYQQGRQAQERADRVVAIVADPRADSRAVPVSDGRATLVTAPAGAVLLASGLPELDTERTYQVWVLRGGRATSAGLGAAGVDAGKVWRVLVEGVRAGDQVAVSVEPREGSEQPTTTPVAVIEV